METSNHILERGRAHLEDGRRELESAKEILSSHPTRDGAEEKLRSSLGSLRSAIDWLEDTEEMEEAHVVLHEVGRLVRETFGCYLTQNGSSYKQTCPAALVHTRLGFSPGFIARKVTCSICEKDPLDCEHIVGRSYGSQICARQLSDLELFEVSIVQKPANPYARIHAVSVTGSELREALGEDFKPGMPVSCDLCLQPCGGFRYPKLTHS